MNLATEIYRFARWTVGVTRRFLRVRPWSTVAVTLASAVDGVLQLLAFLVPLKIILLAASPGIPRYFPFIDPEHKVAWIIGLSVTAVGAYLTSLLLNTLSDRWSRSAGRDVLRGANDIAVHAQEEAQVHSRLKLRHNQVSTFVGQDQRKAPHPQKGPAGPVFRTDRQPSFRILQCCFRCKHRILKGSVGGPPDGANSSVFSGAPAVGRTEAHKQGGDAAGQAPPSSAVQHWRVSKTPSGRYVRDLGCRRVQYLLVDAVAGSFLSLGIILLPAAAGSGSFGCALRSRISGCMAGYSGSTS